MTNNNPNFDPNFIPVLQNPNLQLTLSPSYYHSPRKKRTKTIASSSNSSPKPKYTKKLDPNSPKITRPCTECGKQFRSLKALFGHMRCHPERQWRGINPPPNHRNPTAASSSKKLLNWVSFTSEQDHEVASSLLLLSNTIPSSLECGGSKKVSGSRGHRGGHKNIPDDPIPEDHKGKNVMFSRNHKCNVCFRVFSSGQALGGHMRCHCEREEETKIDGGLDLNVPATRHDLSTLDTSGCSLDLRLGL